MKVRVYRNLHKQCYSLQDPKTRLVIGYQTDLFLKNCTFKVSLTGNAKVRSTKQKNVHAFICGDLANYDQTKDQQDFSLFRKLVYDPYRYTSFVDSVTKKPIKSASLVFLSQDGAYYLV